MTTLKLAWLSAAQMTKALVYRRWEAKLLTAKTIASAEKCGVVDSAEMAYAEILSSMADRVGPGIYPSGRFQ